MRTKEDMTQYNKTDAHKKLVTASNKRRKGIPQSTHKKQDINKLIDTYEFTKLF